MEKRSMRLSYDQNSDVLYISFGSPQMGLDDEEQAGIFIRRDTKTKRVIGVTVMDFEKRFSKSLSEVLPIDLDDVFQISA